MNVLQLIKNKKVKEKTLQSARIQMIKSYKIVKR